MEQPPAAGTDRIITITITVINLVIRFLGGSSRPFCKSILKQFLITLQVFVGSGISLVPMTSLSLSFAAFQDLFYIVAKGLFLSLLNPVFPVSVRTVVSAGTCCTIEGCLLFLFASPPNISYLKSTYNVCLFLILATKF